MNLIPVVIPSYEPDERLIGLLKDLTSAGVKPIILVNDGSSMEYDHYFELSKSIIEPFGGIILKHNVNLGKGKALKDAFQYIIDQFPDAIGCVTADSDGQHTIKCIINCRNMLRTNPQELILGSRNFDSDVVPFKSKFGNILTRGICSFLCGLSVTDTQTGLRGIPLSFMKKLLNVPGDRFEFEMQMLLETKDSYSIREIPIETVYDSKHNHTTHFDIIMDSVRIYRTFGRIFEKFIISSLSSSIVDLTLFYLFCFIMRGRMFGNLYVGIATVCARVVSAVYNYLINYIIVFNSKTSHFKSGLHYAELAVTQMLCSAVIVTVLVMLLKGVPELAAKIPVDIVLFFLSYYIQKRYVF